MKYWERQANIGEPISLRNAAEMHGAPVSTILHRHNGRQTRQEAHTSQLSPGEESALVQFCIRMNRWGFPVRIDIL